MKYLIVTAGLLIGVQSFGVQDQLRLWFMRSQVLARAATIPDGNALIQSAVGRIPVIDNQDQELVDTTNQQALAHKLLRTQVTKNNKHRFPKREKRNHHQPSVLHKQPYK